jgi:6-hydroxytryprostatin B O-methyltransferase
MGGSAGHVSLTLAKKHPNVRFVVQDLPTVKSSFNAHIPSGMKSHISFENHDFFTPQPIKNASIYLLKHIFHNWSDSKGAEILNQIVPAMGQGSRILIIEAIVPEPGTAPLYVDRTMSAMDLHMFTGGNGKERTLEDWKVLLKKTDERLIVENVVQRDDMAFALIEIGLKPEIVISPMVDEHGIIFDSSFTTLV